MSDDTAGQATVLGPLLITVCRQQGFGTRRAAGVASAGWGPALYQSCPGQTYSTADPPWATSQANHSSVKTYLRKVRKWERRGREARGNTKFKWEGGIPRWSTSLPKDWGWRKTNARGRDDSPQKFCFRAGAFQEALWPADKPTMETILQ